LAQVKHKSRLMGGLTSSLCSTSCGHIDASEVCSQTVGSWGHSVLPEPQTASPQPLTHEKDAASADSFGRSCLRALHHEARDEAKCRDVVVVGDFGEDPDDEKALCIATVMERIGLVGQLSVVANTGDAVLRARLAKGLLNQVRAEEVPVAAGSSSHMFTETPESDYIASDLEVDPRGGHELIFAALHSANTQNRKVCFALNSALTDFAAVLQDARWAELRHIVSCVVHMGGVILNANGFIELDASAFNNHCDLEAATFTYDALRRENHISFWVVSRHAAGACKLARNDFACCMCPVSREFLKRTEALSQSVWDRCHHSKFRRMAVGDKLPMRCDPDWYRATFTSMTAVDNQCDEIWPHVQNCSVCDSLATLVAVMSHAECFDQLVDPYVCGNMRVLGLSETVHGIRNSADASDLLREILLLIIGGGNGLLLRQAADLARSSGRSVDVLMVGDFGKDLDDEKALCLAVALERIELVDKISVVANLGDSKMRARLAKGHAEDSEFVCDASRSRVTWRAASCGDL